MLLALGFEALGSDVSKRLLPIWPIVRVLMGLVEHFCPRTTFAVFDGNSLWTDALAFFKKIRAHFGLQEAKEIVT